MQFKYNLKALTHEINEYERVYLGSTEYTNYILYPNFEITEQIIEENLLLDVSKEKDKGIVKLLANKTFKNYEEPGENSTYYINVEDKNISVEIFIQEYLFPYFNIAPF